MTELNDLIASDARYAAARSVAVPRKRDHQPAKPPKAVLRD
jgi:hypothetical protein